MICTNCGRTIADKSVFCKYCGETQRVCPQCGGTLDEDAVFCDKCGKKLSRPAESVQSAEKAEKPAVSAAPFGGFSSALTEKIPAREAPEQSEPRPAEPCVMKSLDEAVKLYPADEPRKSRTKVIVIVIIITILAVIGMIVGGIFIALEKKYAEATNLYETECYSAASNAFKSISMYRDSEELAKECDALSLVQCGYMGDYNTQLWRVLLATFENGNWTYHPDAANPTVEFADNDGNRLVFTISENEGLFGYTYGYVDGKEYATSYACKVNMDSLYLAYCDITGNWELINLSTLNQTSVGSRNSNYVRGIKLDELKSRDYEYILATYPTVNFVKLSGKEMLDENVNQGHRDISADKVVALFFNVPDFDYCHEWGVVDSSYYKESGDSGSDYEESADGGESTNSPYDYSGIDFANMTSRQINDIFKGEKEAYYGGYIFSFGNSSLTIYAGPSSEDPDAYIDDNVVDYVVLNGTDIPIFGDAYLGQVVTYYEDLFDLELQSSMYSCGDHGAVWKEFGVNSTINGQRYNLLFRAVDNENGCYEESYPDNYVYSVKISRI